MLPRSRPFALLLGLTLLAAPRLGAQGGGSEAADVFRRYANRVVKIQVVESGSAAKATIGSGFFVSAEGHVITNYHVIAKVIDAPERYRVELIDAARAPQPARILAIDVVHDVAVLGTDLHDHPHFVLALVAAEQGDRLYSLGHPEDLGLSIVEGTYNGYLPHARQPRIHFTGSLNPGMSGGPTIAEDGRVVGINVATAGNQLSFLVPVEHATALMRQVAAAGRTPPPHALADVGRQIREYQELYLRDMFAGETKMVELGPFRVPTEPAPFFRCWADATRSEERPYETVRHRCSTDDDLFISGDQSSGVVGLQHELITTRKLNALRFYALYTQQFKRDDTPGGDEEYVTSWRCGTRNVRNGDTPMRAVLCLRRYRKLGELYDAVLKVAVLGRSDAGLISTLTLQGVTSENVTRLSRRYLEHVAWR